MPSWSNKQMGHEKSQSNLSRQKYVKIFDFQFWKTKQLVYEQSISELFVFIFCVQSMQIWTRKFEGFWKAFWWLSLVSSFSIFVYEKSLIFFARYYITYQCLLCNFETKTKKEFSIHLRNQCTFGRDHPEK